MRFSRYAPSERPLHRGGVLRSIERERQALAYIIEGKHSQEVKR